jgi:hypothetical protein
MTAAEFFTELAVLTLSQLISLFAGVFIFGLLIHFISHLTFNSLGKAFGNAGIYIVAWLGTPIHELGHALFCIIFRHKIVRIEFFKPDPQTGTLGYVNHQWNRSSPWQVLGNFFIGIGPMILGCLVLLGIFYWLVPDSAQAWESIRAGAGEIADGNTFGGYLTVLKDSLLTLTRLLFTVDNIAGWQFWVFCYLSICVAANIRLSLSDIKGSLSGFGCIVILIILVNVIGLLFGLGSEGFLPYTASLLGLMYGLFILALIMTGIGFVITYLVSAVWVRLRYGKVLNPF